jgi:hypothetical protein
LQSLEFAHPLIVTSFRRPGKSAESEENSGLLRLKSMKSPTRIREEPEDRCEPSGAEEDLANNWR